MASVDPLLTHDGGIPTQTTSEDVLDRKVFIGGLSWQTTAENLRNYFQNFGDIAEAVLMIDKRTGQPRGFGFVTFLNTAGKFHAFITLCLFVCFQPSQHQLSLPCSRGSRHGAGHTHHRQPKRGC